MKTGWALFESAKPSKIHRILLMGVPGTGKTYNACKSADEKGYYTVTLNEESSISELLGMWVPKGKEFFFQDGAAVKAWKEGKLLVINEIDKASGSVMTILHAILDDIEIAGLSIPTKQQNGNYEYIITKPAEGFRVVATMNGTINDLPLALADRFDLKISIEEPHPDAINALPKDLREMAKAAYSSKDISITFREIVAYSKLREVLGAQDALMAFGSKAKDVKSYLNMGTRESSASKTPKTYQSAGYATASLK